jgi:predicted ester cyclase
MSLDDNKAIVRAYVETVRNRRQLEPADEVVAPDFVDHAPLPGHAGAGRAKRKWAMYLDAIPDLGVTIEKLVAEGDKVAVRRSYEGAHRGNAGHWQAAADGRHQHLSAG